MSVPQMTPGIAVDAGELNRILVESVRDYAIFALDPRGHVLSWNPGAERIKGYTAAEIIGRHFSVFFPAEDLAAGKPARELEAAEREGKYEEEGWRLRRDGSRFWANVVITPLRGSGGELLGYAKVTRDLTERRAAEERSIADARRIAEVESANRTRSEFLAAMSHELRTPINGTLGYAELLAVEVAGPLSEQQRVYVGRIRDSQRHLLRIVNDLLDYSRVEAGRIEYERAPVPVHDVVDTVLPMVEPQARAKGLHLAHGPCPTGIIAATDRARAEQIVLNLLSNAVRYTPPGGRIHVDCAAGSDRVRVTVADTGPGVPAGEQESIFQPFVQLGRSLTSGHEGTGLGLAISRDLARGMGGDVTVRSEAGEGAAFTLVLPAAGMERSDAPARGARGRPEDGGGGGLSAPSARRPGSPPG
jgi:PAS domain S-box-containing protein